MQGVPLLRMLAGILVIATLAGAEAAKPPAKPPSSPPSLSAANQKLLDSLFKQFLFDPKGAQYVRVKTLERGGPLPPVEVIREGWLVPGEAGKAARVYFIDGESIEAPDPSRIEKIDFLDQCRKRYSEAEKPAGTDDDQAAVRLLIEMLLEQAEQRDLVLAAWLYRLGQPELAAKALALARLVNTTRGSSLLGDDPANETEDDRMVRAPQGRPGREGLCPNGERLPGPRG